jgi:hypothetical protein
MVRWSFEISPAQNEVSIEGNYLRMRQDFLAVGRLPDGRRLPRLQRQGSANAFPMRSTLDSRPVEFCICSTTRPVSTTARNVTPETSCSWNTKFVDGCFMASSVGDGRDLEASENATKLIRPPSLFSSSRIGDKIEAKFGRPISGI